MKKNKKPRTRKYRYDLFLKIGGYLLAFAVALYVGENFYFGWNDYPMSEAEEIVDQIVIWSFTIGVLIYWCPVVQLYEDAIKKMNDRKNNEIDENESSEVGSLEDDSDTEG